MPKFVQKHCPTCHGTGEAMISERIDDTGYWCAFGDCHCVEYRYTEDEKRLIRNAVLMAGLTQALNS